MAAIFDAAGPSRLGAALGAGIRSGRAAATATTSAARRAPRSPAAAVSSGTPPAIRARGLWTSTPSNAVATSAVGAEPAAVMSSVHPAFGGLAQQLSTTQPCFGVKGENVSILRSPTVFHDTLLDMIKDAKRRILISSLYIGTEEESLVDAVTTALSTRPGVRATFVLDYNRATRPGKPGTSPVSTVHMLLPLLERFPDRVDVWLYRSPKLKGVLEKIVPPRFNEGWGTWHAKYYAVDDDVVLSGANLAESYFTNRQDRYVRLNAHPALLSYLSSLTRLLSDYSYKLVAHPRPGAMGQHGVPLAASTGGSPAAAVWRGPSSLPPRAWAAHAHATLTAFQQAWRASNGVRARDAAATMGADTWFWPVIQAGALGVREEEAALMAVFDAVADAARGASAQPVSVDVDLTSGYFGLYKAYKSAVIASPAPVRVIAASPQANGFYGSKGVSRLVPEGYTLLERRFYAAAERAGRLSAGGVRLQEWQRDGWTYHAKGMWVSPPHEAPFVTFLGSSNLSTRSLDLDTELSMVLATASAPLREALGEELEGLRAYAHDVDAATWARPDRHVSLYAKVLVALGVEGML